MWNNIRRWLWGRFLPAWCKEDLLEENARLSGCVGALRQENQQLSAYIRGMETAMRSQRRWIIGTEVKK